MPVTKQMAIRLALHGCVNRPFYHVVVMYKHKGRNVPPIEQLGSYDPMPNIHNEKMVALNFDRIKHYIARGAEPSVPVKKLLGLAGFLPLHPMTYIEAKRNRKAAEEAKAAASPSENTPSETQSQQSSSEASS